MIEVQAGERSPVASRRSDEPLTSVTANINVEPRAIAKGWMPAHSDTGEPTVWFSARGC